MVVGVLWWMEFALRGLCIAWSMYFGSVSLKVGLVAYV